MELGRKEAQKALNIPPEVLEAIPEQTADAVLVTDRDGIIKYVNPSACIVTGKQIGRAHV